MPSTARWPQFLSRLTALSCEERASAVRPRGGGGKGSWNEVLCGGKKDHSLFSDAQLIQKDNSWLQPVCGHHGETHDVVTPPRHVPMKQVGITFSHRYSYKFLRLF